MRSIRLVCTKCGYQKDCLESEESIRECPICNSKGSLELDKESEETLMYQKVKEHIQEGFRKFGIEKTLEFIQKDFKSPKAQEYYIETVKKEWKELGICFTKLS